MRPKQDSDGASTRELAWEILRRVEQEDAFASRLLDDRQRAVEDPRDSALLHELVLGVLRSRSLLDHVIGSVSSRPLEKIDLGVLVALRIGAYTLLFLDRVPEFAAVDTAVSLVKRRGARSAAAFVNGVLREIARRGPSAIPPRPPRGNVPGLALRHSHPEWWVRRVVGRLGWDRAIRLLESNNTQAPTTLRPNLRRTTPRDLELRLLEEGVLTEPGKVIDEALRVKSGRAQTTRVFGDGYAWIQDEASQLIPRLFGRVLRPAVLDACAAPGTKTLQLAEALPVGGVLVATDVSAVRLVRLGDNVRRLGVDVVRPVVADMTLPRAPFRERFDHVLVDAPCSGTGTLRRHPEIRWRLRPEDLAALATRQQRILETASGLVASGGSLVYAVCSMEPEEGPDVVMRFLDRHPEFILASLDSRLPERARKLIQGKFLRTTPMDDGLDGFCGAALVRE